MIFKFDLITGPGQNHMMPQAGVHTAIQNTQPGTHPQFIPQGRSVIMSNLRYTKSETLQCMSRGTSGDVSSTTSTIYPARDV